MAAALVATSALVAHATPYASLVQRSGTTVNFVLNEPADLLTYSINGGAAVTIDGSTKGPKTFSLNAPTDTFSIVAEKTAATGFTIPNGTTVSYDVAPNDTPDFRNHGLFRDSPGAHMNIISDVTSPLTNFFIPTSVSVSKNPNSPNFGHAYISEGTGGTTALGRTVADGIYALRADGADAYGYGDTAQNPNVDGSPAFVASASSPHRLFVGEDGAVWATDYTDTDGQLYRLAPDLLTAVNTFGVYNGSPTLPTGQNHGSITSVYVEGTSAASNLKIYTIDEDLTTFSLTGAGTTLDKNSLWRYDVDAGTLPIPDAQLPTRINDSLLAGPNADVTRGADGKWYLAQYRAQSIGSTTLYVVSPDGATVLFNSKQATNALEDPDPDYDILQYTRGIAVSPNQDWIALMLNGSDVAVMPLVSGIPQLDQRMVVDVQTGVQIIGRDIEFDAAGNLHFVSSAHERYRVLAPGGHTVATTTWNGTDFDFSYSTIAPPADDADFDGDGDVDGADFLTWQRGLGMAAPGNPADQADGDANGDMDVDADDLAVWTSQFPNTVAVAAAVPEPSTWALLLVAAGLAGSIRRSIA